MLEERISEWRSHLLRRQAIQSADVDELEDHLRSQVDELKGAGLAEDEAFLIAIKRIGALEAISREFAREYSERLWKRLVLAPGDNRGGAAWNVEATVAVALAVVAAIAFKVPELFGLHLDADQEIDSFYWRNMGFFALPFLAGFFAWKRALAPGQRLRLVVPFAAGLLVINLFPFRPGGHTELLSSLHILIALWLVVGYAYAAGDWRDHNRRMNFIRFSGEWFIYYALIALGGGVLMLITTFIFQAIGLNAEAFLVTWVLPCGALGAVIIAAWLVEAKQSVIENMAPVLTMIFTPLFTLALAIFLFTVLWTGRGIDLEREVLIGFDLLLVLVVGLIVYAISARDPQKAPGFFDALQLVLVVCALVVDALALWAILARISDFGFSPNRVAALGENLILVVNLAWAAVLYWRFLKGRAGFAAVERWQTAYLPVYAAWASIVVVLFPLVFWFE